VPELTAAATDAQLQAFIDAAPPIEIEAIPAGPIGPEEELAELRLRLADAAVALNQANSQIETLQDAAKASAAELAAAQSDGEAMGARIGELEAKLAEASKAPAAPAEAKTKAPAKAKPTDTKPADA
ncbi:MAG: hypothetical protein VX218_16835, partial [Pseudomonadota bacterium]|nr:hypothetical protein [Pseudomonadota bacterium]